VNISRTFETSTRFTLDISSIPVVQSNTHLPVIVDPSHAGGKRELVLPLARAALGAGADGLIIDVHPRPEVALCDGPQALVRDDLLALKDDIARFAVAAGRTVPEAGQRSRGAVGRTG
jgi:3-deoxy-7-phosphoheptulonate synthase